MAKTIIVTAANEAFSSLLVELLQSMHQCRAGNYDAIGVLDVGLSSETLQVIRNQVTTIVVPEWDLPVDASLRESKPHLRAILARPYLRKYFPGYSLYLWLDADTWVQERYALEWFVAAARNGSMGLAPQIDRSYRHPKGTLKWRKHHLLSYFGESALPFLYSHPYFNAGAFSLGVDAPHWAAWEKYLRAGIEASPHLVTDQAALNFAIWKDSLPVHPLPALCNWCCHLAIPSINERSGKLCEPYVPYQPLGLIHLTAQTKNLRLNMTIEGRAFQGSLRFRGITMKDPLSAD